MQRGRSTYTAKIYCTPIRNIFLQQMMIAAIEIGNAENLRE